MNNTFITFTKFQDNVNFLYKKNVKIAERTTFLLKLNYLGNMC